MNVIKVNITCDCQDPDCPRKEIETGMYLICTETPLDQQSINEAIALAGGSIEGTIQLHNTSLYNVFVKHLMRVLHDLNETAGQVKRFLGLSRKEQAQELAGQIIKMAEAADAIEPSPEDRAKTKVSTESEIDRILATMPGPSTIN